jgi:hypothetical protein
MDMVEKVARAIYASHAFNDNHDSLNPGFDGLRDDWREVLFANARAAIEAMRTVDEPMRIAAVNTQLPGIGEPPLYEKLWQAMLDAALNPQTSP